MNLARFCLKSMVFCMFLLGIVPFVNGQDFEEHLINGNFEGARNVRAVDLDEDGDMDIVAAGYEEDEIAWWENDGNQDFTKHVIQSNYDGAIRVRAVDIDSDGDIDILGAAYRVRQVHWWENDGEENFTQHLIDDYFCSCRSLCGEDLDADGDIDILATADTDNRLVWWENDGNENFTFTIIDGTINYPYCVTTTDMNEDGNMDVLTVANYANEIILYMNDGQENFEENVIVTDFLGTREALAFDLDEDGDKDIIGTSWTLNEMRWWENDGEENFTEYSISDECGDIQSFAVGDLDLDNDIDIVTASPESDVVYIWYNDGEENFTRYTLNDFFDHATSLYIEDMDLDGDLDILGTAYYANDLVWWENLSVQDYVDFEFLLVPFEDPVLIEPGGGQFRFHAFVTNLENFPVEATVWADIILPNGHLYGPVVHYPNITFDPDELIHTRPVQNVPQFANPGTYIYRARIRPHILADTTYTESFEFEKLPGAAIANANIEWDTFGWGEAFESGQQDNIVTTDEVPSNYELVSVYPNPFNPSTSVTIGLPESSYLQVSVYNVVGQQVAVLANNRLEAGIHSFTFDATDLSSGVYFINASVPGELNQVNKVLLVR